MSRSPALAAPLAAVPKEIQKSNLKGLGKNLLVSGLKAAQRSQFMSPRRSL